MPLHHIGGIVANIYAPLASGSGAVYPDYERRGPRPETDEHK